MIFQESAIDLPFYWLRLSLMEGPAQGCLSLKAPSTKVLSSPCGDTAARPLRSLWCLSIFYSLCFFCELLRPVLKFPSCFRNQLQVHNIGHSCVL